MIDILLDSNFVACTLWLHSFTNNKKISWNSKNFSAIYIFKAHKFPLLIWSPIYLIWIWMNEFLLSAIGLMNSIREHDLGGSTALLIWCFPSINVLRIWATIITEVNKELLLIFYKMNRKTSKFNGAYNNNHSDLNFIPHAASLLQFVDV